MEIERVSVKSPHEEYTPSLNPKLKKLHNSVELHKAGNGEINNRDLYPWIIRLGPSLPCVELKSTRYFGDTSE